MLPSPISASHARQAFFAITAFKFTNAGGQSRFGRFRLSPEAGTAAAAFRAAESDLGAQLLACGSGVELAGHGYRGDVTIAAELDASDGVPVLAGLRFTRFASGNAGQCSHDEP